MSILIAVALQAAVADAGPDPAFGLWTNPKGSLQVRTRRCGAQLCGTVVSASAHAIEKARAAGTPALIGTELFSNYTRASDGSWTGSLFVPDRNRKFSSTLKSDGRTLQVSGCLLGRFICKTQVWTRADRLVER